MPNMQCNTSDETFKSLPSCHQFRVMQEIKEKQEKQRGVIAFYCDIKLTLCQAEEEKKTEKRELGTFGMRRETLADLPDPHKKVSPNTLLEKSVSRQPETTHLIIACTI